MKSVSAVGLDRVLANPKLLAHFGRLGFLTHHGAITRNAHNAVEALHRALGTQITTLFGPQHGLSITVQDNMQETKHFTHPLTKLPLYSLYSETRKPTPEMFSNIDTLVVDLQDVGTRVYTYIATLKLCLEAANEMGKQVVILDRPNPLGPTIEGPIAIENEFSFVANMPLPWRHGLSMGEVALFCAQHFHYRSTPTVITYTGDLKSHQQIYPWVLPSPNLPTREGLLPYCALVVLEGTNVSEGRGTTRPFEIFGHPQLDGQAFKRHFKLYPEIELRPIEFIPTFNKFKGEVCQGFFVHILDASRFKPFHMSALFLWALKNTLKDEFKYLQTPYEYEFNRLPIDVIYADKRIRQIIDNSATQDALMSALNTLERESSIAYPDSILQYQRTNL